MNESDALLILNAMPGLTNGRIKKLIEHFGSARNAVVSCPRQWETLLPEPAMKKIRSFRMEEFLLKEKALINKNNISIVNYYDLHYPEHLKAIPDAPVVLYMKGQLRRENDLALALVGSRRASMYGLLMAEKFAAGVAELGITVVSGMARGIDTAAHRGALKVKGPTIAVIGCGLSHVYPPENKKLAEEIAGSGAVISEFPMEMQPLAHNFPRRNRIISGLSLGVIVIEASRKSGALITADQALEQGREVFALPGRVDHPNSQGVHGLIKQGAKLIHSLDDVLEELQPQLEHILREAKRLQEPGIPAKAVSPVGLTAQEQRIFGLLSDSPVHLDDLAQQSGHSIAAAMSVLLQMEMKKLVRQMPGKRFVKY
jgi:DNA processing protein